MALFDSGVNNIAETIGVDPGSTRDEGEAFSRELNVGDFDSFGGDVTVGKYTEIASFQVPADTKYAYGYGRATNPENQGYLYVDLQSSTPNPVEGTIRFIVQSSTGRRTEVVKDFDTERLDASKTDRTQMVPMPEQVNSALATQDAYLRIQLNPAPSNTDQSVDSAQSEVIIPATEYDLS